MIQLQLNTAVPTAGLLYTSAIERCYIFNLRRVIQYNIIIV